MKGKTTMFITLLIWIFCFYSWASMVVISESSTFHDKYFACIYIAILCILILLKCTLCKIRKKNIKKCILDSAIPVLHLLFFICHSNIMYGYGNTMGIIGRSEVIGLFSIINVSYNMAFILMGVIYVVLWLVMILKYNMSEKPNKRITFIAIVLGIAVEVMGICKFIFTSELSLIYLFSIAIFWMFNLINYIALKVKSLND